MPDAAAYHRVRHELGEDAEKLLFEMFGTAWRTKEALHAATGISTHALSARMSDLRAAGYSVEKRHAGGRVYEYRVPSGATA